jgi:hypothetical protein
MVRLGGAASPTYISVFRGLQAHFRRYGIELDWVLYADYDALVEAFVKREIDLAWNAPLAYVKIKRRLQNPCQVVAMRDVDVNFTTHFITHAGSGISTVQDLKGKRLALGSRGSVQAGLLPYYFLQQLGLNPAHDLAVCSFCEEREASADWDERDVVERVAARIRCWCCKSADHRGPRGRGDCGTGRLADHMVQSGVQSLLLHGTQRHGSGVGP